MRVEATRRARFANPGTHGDELTLKGGLEGGLVLHGVLGEHQNESRKVVQQDEELANVA